MWCFLEAVTWEGMWCFADIWEATWYIERIKMEPHKQWEESLALLHCATLCWSSLVFPGLPWSSLVFSGLPWSSLVFPGLPWSSLVFPGLLWSSFHREKCTTKTSCGIPADSGCFRWLLLVKPCCCCWIVCVLTTDSCLAFAIDWTAGILTRKIGIAPRNYF